MKRKILLIVTAVLGALVGWIIIEPWHEGFSSLRDMLILVVVGLMIVVSMVSFNYFYYKKMDLLQRTMRNPLIYILPIVGAILAKLLFSNTTQNIEVVDRTSYNTVMLLDVSGSMSGELIEELKSAVEEFIKVKEAANSSDEIAVITFATETRVLSNFTNDYKRIKSIIPDLHASGGTIMSDGLKVANNLIRNNSEVPVRILLLTDGEPFNIEAVLNQVRLIDVPIDVIGVGYDYDEHLCKVIASQTVGQFYPTNDIDKLTGTFRKIAGGITQAGPSSIPIVYRVMGWMLYGLFLGLAINIEDKKRDKIVIGIIGGLIGGLLSSLLFVFIDSFDLSGSLARAFSFMLFALILVLSLLIVESLYKKLSGNTQGQFDFSKIKLDGKA